MSDLVRDSVNRNTKEVVLPIKCPYTVGTTVKIRNLREADIDCMVRDANEYGDPSAKGVGDAIFDANNVPLDGNTCDANGI